MKKISKILVLLTLVICLSGCMKINLEMEVKSSTEMTMKIDYMVEEKFLTMAGMTSQQLMDQMKESMGDAASGAKITPKSETIDGSKWEGMTITGSIKESEMKTLLSEKEIDGKKCVVLTLAKDFMSGNQFGGMDADKITKQTGYSIEKLKALGMEMNVIINMPADAKSNFGKVDGNKVTIDLLELSAKGSTVQKIEISSPLSKGFDMTFVYIGAGAVVLLGIVFVIMKKKKAPAAPTQQVFESATPVQEPAKEITQEPVEETTPEVTEAPVEETTPEVTEAPAEEVTVEVTEAPAEEATVEVTEAPAEEATVEVTEAPAEEATPEVTEKPQEVVNENVIHCPNCGEQVKADDAFCQKCGFGLKK
ncbi:MAG: zinc-ribbon domain-containing protein [Coprobacillus sp.]